MFNNGKKPQEIAAARKLTLSTIENHLEHLIWAGELDLNKLMHSDRIEKVRKALESCEGETISPAKEMLGEDFSYGEIRWVKAEMER
jgi:ATP-dependent DNA helicase RecQ